jgi:hypothetical protein
MLPMLPMGLVVAKPAIGSKVMDGVEGRRSVQDPESLDCTKHARLLLAESHKVNKQRSCIVSAAL